MEESEVEIVDPVKKEYACFVCGVKSDEKGLPLLVSETTYSRICLGQKLQEILSDKFIVLIKPKDTICWDCAEVINWVDKYEIKIDIAKDHVVNKILENYKKVEINVRKEETVESEDDYMDVSSPEESTKVYYKDPTYTPKPVQAPSTVTPAPIKVKKFPCKICNKLYATAAAAGAHAAKVHRNQYSCEVCNEKFSTEKKLQNHSVIHQTYRNEEQPKIYTNRYICNVCKETFTTAKSYKIHMMNHQKTPQVENEKPFICITCGFETKNTEVYCRHVCNSSVMSLTCTTCKKRYVDSTSKDKRLKYQCQSCIKITDHLEIVTNDQIEIPVYEQKENFKEQEDTVVQIVQKQEPEIQVEENEQVINNGGISEINEEMLQNVENDLPDSIMVTDDAIIISEETEIMSEKHESYLINQRVSYLKCTNCDEEFELSQLARHKCFIRGEVVEFAEVERVEETQYYTVPFFKNEDEIQETIYESEQTPVQKSRKSLKVPAQEHSFQDEVSRMTCKTCGIEFKTIGLMRQHWDLTGHTREVSTTKLELNKIRDKTKKTEKTFKVVKQNFHIRANVPGQNDEEIKKNDDFQIDCIVKFQNDMSVEDFIGMRGGKGCGACGVLFGSEDLLKEHQQNNCLTCVTCNVTFFDNKLLKKHYQYTGHANRPKKLDEPYTTLKPEQDSFGCHICFKTFFSRFVLGKHLQKHYKGTSKGVCHYCQMEFEDKAQIQQHVLEVHGAQLYKCNNCDRTFLTESVRNRHQAKHKIYTCKVCKSKFSSQRNLLLHIEKTHRKSSSCIICGKNISDLRALKRHEKMHFYGKTLHCDLCKKTFRNKSALKSHPCPHQNEARYTCETCGQGFKLIKSYEEHKIVHIKNEYTCPKCSVVCPSRIFYWMHLKLHESAYKCSVCSRKFRDTSLLAIHRRKHWRVRPYQCPHCPRVFSVPATLKRHLTLHTRAYPYRCVLCKKGFLTKYAFHKHLDTIHSVGQQPKKQDKKIPSLPFNATDEDIFQAADTLMADDIIMFSDFSQKDVSVEQVPSSDLITNEVVVETTELFDVLT